jgi:hypothetical protein
LRGRPFKSGKELALNTDKERPNRAWLETALQLDPYLVSNFPPIDEMTARVITDIGAGKNPKMKYAAKTILLNLIVASDCGVPIYYSRRTNDYCLPKRYGKLYFKYNTIIKIMDELERSDYIIQFMGFYDKKTSRGMRTRACANEKLKDMMCEWVNSPEFSVYRSKKDECIILKDDDKKLLDYSDTDRTLEMRKTIEEFNEYAEDYNITLKLTSQDAITPRQIVLLSMYCTIGLMKLNEIQIVDNTHLFETNRSETQSKEYDKEIQHNLNTNDKHDRSTDIPNKTYKDNIITTDREEENLYTTNERRTFLSSITDKILELSKEDNEEMDLDKEFRLIEFGIHSIDFTIKYKYFHRVFNNCSFDLGGRFYGPHYQSLSKNLRKCIYIDGEPIVELDFSAFHVRMLYHIENIDYKEDPYFALCSEANERQKFKLLQLVCLNAPNLKTAIKGIRKSFIDNRIFSHITDKDLNLLYQRFSTEHRRISKYLLSGIGLELQNYDSRITERILYTLYNNNIPALPVHDSYIVNNNYGDLLYDIMNDIYREMFKYEPVIE